MDSNIAFNTNNSILLIYLYTVKWLNITVWLIDGTLTSTATQGQRGPWSNGNEEVLHIPKISRTGTSLSNGLESYPGHLLEWSVLLLCRDAVSVVNSLTQLDIYCQG